MNTKTFRFKKGEKYRVDDTDHILSDFGNSFQNVDEEGMQDDTSDDLICLRDCSVTIRIKR